MSGPATTQAVANRVGALATAIEDRVTEAVAEATGMATTSTTALSALHHFLEAPSVELLRQVLGLTHSGAVRLVDRLERDGYVERRAGPDSRTISVSITPAGRRVARRASTARDRVVVGALAPLSTGEIAAVDRLLGRVLRGMKRGDGATSWICRRCHTDVCGVERGECPLADERFSIAEGLRAVEAAIADRLEPR